jgi:hypothetical protein
MTGCHSYEAESMRKRGVSDPMDYLVMCKLGIVPPKGETSAMVQGTDEEDENARGVEAITGLELIHGVDLGVQVHPSGEFGASPDRIFRWIPMLLECKSKTRRKFTMHNPSSPEHVIPPDHYMQA